MAYSGLTLVTPPATEPLTVADAVAHSIVTSSADDALVGAYIRAAREYCEMVLGRGLLTQTWRLALRAWPGRDYVNGPREYSDLNQYYRWNYIELPMAAPLQSVTSVAYTGSDGTGYTMTAGYPPGGSVGQYYLVDTEQEPGRIYLPFACVWPTVILTTQSPIRITYVCGYPSFSGTVNVASGGKAVTWASGTKFDNSLVGTFFDVAGVSSSVATVTSDTTLTLTSAVSVANGQAFVANGVPHSIKQAMLLLVTHYYENREAAVMTTVGANVTSSEIQFAVNALLGPFRVIRFSAQARD